MDLRVTTIIPTYRRPELLGRAIRSVLAQPHPQLEVLVCDNASGDGTRDVVEKFITVDPRVRYRLREKNLGVNGNIGAGFQEVQTPYCSVLPDDDVMLPDFYPATLRGMLQHPEAVFSAGRSLLMTEAGMPVSVMPGFRTRAGYYTAPHGILSLISGHMVSHMAMNGILYRTDIARQHWPTSAEDGSPSDIEFILRLSARYPYVLCDEVILLICLHEANLAKSRIPLYQGWLEVYRKLSSGEWLEEPCRSAAERRFFVQLRNAYTKIWLRCIVQGNWGEAYILADLLEEEFGLSGWSRTLFKATQFFRKNPDSTRRMRLCRALERKDQAYGKRFLHRYAKYARFFREYET
ncbi:glycosyltransferase [bacterium]|nr:MAG: glycosyltransferase [bacterium]